MYNTVEMFIYHDTENKMLIVNHDTKCYDIITDHNIINLFRTKYELMNIHFKSPMDIAILISELVDNEYERII